MSKVNLKNIELEEKYLNPLSKTFTPIVIDQLSNYGKSKYLNEICKNSGIINQLDLSEKIYTFFELIYNILQEKYRNEYVYKNIIAEKILLSKHTLNTSQMLSEFRVGNCKADVVIINGTSSVYEIKSDFDSTKRLERQISSYFKIFDYINVITSNKNLKNVRKITPKNVGLLILNDKMDIETIREPISNKTNIDKITLFDSLHKAEYLKIIKKFYNYIPEVPNTQIHNECKKLFCKITNAEAHDLAMKTLFHRNNLNRIKDFLAKAPPSLTAYAFRKNVNKKYYSFIELLSNPIGSILSW